MIDVEEGGIEMKEIDILANFEREINMIDNAVEKPSTDDSLFWLNQAVGKFTKERFNGDLVHRTSYEQNEKRRTDLIKLFKSKSHEGSDFDYTNEQPSYDQYGIKYPEDFLFSLNEDVVISDMDGDHKMDTCMFECTQDSFMYRITNSLTDFHYRYHRARPLRIRNVDGCELLTDKNYKIHKYTLGYLRKPKEITLEKPFEEYTDFEDIIMSEIIKIAAQMYLENKKDERYKTISYEVNTQE
jgi:hypothetical protein